MEIPGTMIVTLTRERSRMEMVLALCRRYCHRKVYQPMNTLKLFPGIIAPAIGVMFAAATAQAATYYVDKNHGGAGDGNSGAENSPWKTIQHAVDVVSAGDTVYIKEGTYAERVFLAGSSGKEGDSGNASSGYITYAGYPGDKVVLDGSSFSDWGSAFMSGKWAGGRAMHYIAIRDLTVRDYPESGIVFEEDSQTAAGSIGSHHIIIDNVTTHGNGFEGILFVGGDAGSGGESYGIVVRNCTSHDNGHHGIKFSGENSGVFNRRQIRDSVIENCVSYSNGFSGTDGIGIHVSTGALNVTVRNNISYNNARQGLAGHEVFDCTYEGNESYGNGQRGDGDQDGIVLWNSKNITVQNNHLHHNLGNGLFFWKEQTASANVVENNVIHDNSLGGVTLSLIGSADFRYNTLANNGGVGLMAANVIGGNSFKGNLIYQNSTQVSANADDTYDYNLYYPAVTFPWKGENSVTADPLFENEGARDYRLLAGSPAVDAAASCGVEKDFDGIPRPQGTGCDMGAFERQAKTNASPTANAGTDQTITLSESASLDGTVADDGLPSPPGAVTSLWAQVSGPGTVTFGDASRVDTTADFSAAGTYTLRLSAYDGALSGSDDVVVIVNTPVTPISAPSWLRVSFP